MRPAQIRKLLRLFHLVIGSVAAVAIYVPAIDAGVARLVVGIAIPLLGITGIALWQQAALRKLLRRNARGSNGSVQVSRR